MREVTRMGLQREIQFPQSAIPGWDAIAALLRRSGESASVRMIDGLPAFPDEVPEPGWSELRIGFTAGMVTLRKSDRGLACVVWGNADHALQTAWNRLCWAVATAGGGTIAVDSESLSPSEFASRLTLVIRE